MRIAGVRRCVWAGGCAAVVAVPLALFSNGAAAVSPSAAPVAYDAGSQGPLAIVNADGSQDHQVAGASNLARPVWRPDGAQLAVTSFAGDTPTGTAILSPDGAAQRAVGPPAALSVVGYSPDGQQLALTDAPTLDGRDLLVVDVSSGRVHSVWDKSKGILFGGGRYGNATWAPDGSRLALTAAPPGCYEGDCPFTTWVVNADGADLHALPNSEGLSAMSLEWSPDGQWILGDDLAVIHPDGAGRHQLLPITPPRSALDAVWSPDGTEIAYVLVNLQGGSDSLWVVGADGSAPRQLFASGGATDQVVHPSWLPNGSGIVFGATVSGAQRVDAVNSDGSGLRQLASGGDPAVPSLVTRAAGATRVETAVSLSRLSHATAETVVVARDDLYPDALAAGPLAAKMNAPLLLSPPTGVPSTLADEIGRLGATTAYLIGDTTALSSDVETELRAAGITSVHRIGGATRYDTAALIAAEVGGTAVYIARGDDFPDAASVSALASYQRRPILLTTRSAMPPVTAAELQSLGAEQATIVGGPNAVSPTVGNSLAAVGVSVDRLAGANRYGTSAAVADRAAVAGMTGQNWLADGANWPDAVAAGPAAALLNGNLVLVDPNDLSRSPEARDWLAGHRSDAVTAVGGPDVVSPKDAVDALGR